MNQQSMTDKAVDTVSDAADAAMDTAKQAADTAQMLALEAKKVIRTSVTNEPMMTLLVAVGLGFVVGALWKS